MTFDQYIYNPMGKGSTANTAVQRDYWKQVYTRKYGEIMLREAGKINYRLFYDEKANVYVAYISIPSEVVKDFYYDVIIEFSCKDNSLKNDLNLNKYDVRFFSNDPSFVFTYLKVFKDEGMFIEWMKGEEPRKALKEDPKVRNPYKIPGYVKSIYFAYLFMKSKGFFVKTNYKIQGSKLDKKNIKKAVMPAEKKIALRQEAGEKIEKEKRKEKQKSDRVKKQTIATRKNISSGSGFLGAVKNSKKVGTISQSKFTKTAKTVGRSSSIKGNKNKK